jgi:septal ring factor EnvC (AmiA/AmiB activator)
MMQVSDQRKIPPPREFTDKGLNMHEFQTVKAQLERSELTLAEKTRELRNCELTIKGLEEQKAEAERRYEILSNSTGDHERHLRLLHEDLDALRAKLELKNQVQLF